MGEHLVWGPNWLGDSATSNAEKGWICTAGFLKGAPGYLGISSRASGGGGSAVPSVPLRVLPGDGALRAGGLSVGPPFPTTLVSCGWMQQFPTPVPGDETKMGIWDHVVFIVGAPLVLSAAATLVHHHVLIVPQDHVVAVVKKQH